MTSRLEVTAREYPTGPWAVAGQARASELGVWDVAPRARPLSAGSSRVVELPATVRVGIEEAQSGVTIALTEAELDRWAETGEFPERVDTWAASLASRRST